MEEVLKIKIAAESTGLEQSSAQSIAALNNLQASLNKTGLSINTFASTLKAYGTNAGVLSRSSKEIADGLKAIQSSAAGFTIKPIVIEADVDTSTIASKLQAASRAIKLNIETPQVAPIPIPVVADTDRIQDQLQTIAKPVEVPVAVDIPTNSLQSLKAQITALQGSKISVPVELGVYQNAINQLKQDLKATKVSLPPITVPPVPNPLPPAFKKNVVDGTNAITGLSRVLQDAPYGFIGIANNLNPMLEGFQQLSRNAKESGQSVKSVLLKSLTGAGGLGLGLSLITTALSFATIGFAAWTRGMGSSADKLAETKKRIQEAKQALQDYVDTLDDIPKFNLIGSQNAQDEIVRLETLYKATQNANIPLAERKKIVDELQSQYPRYFKSLSDETILAGGAEEAYKKLSAAIISSARARAAQEQIVQIQKELLAVEKQHADAVKSEVRSYMDYQKVIKSSNKPSAPTGFGGASAFGQGIASMNQAQNKYNEAAQTTNNLWQRIVTLQGRSKQLADEVQKIIQENPDTVLDFNSKINPPSAKEQFNFFDKFFDVKPAKEQIEKQFLDMYETARDFAEKNSEILVGLEPIINAPSKEKTIEEGRKFWEKYRQGIMQFKIPKIQPVVQVEPIADPIPGKTFSELFSDALKGNTEELDFSALLDRDKIIKDFELQFKQLGQKLPKTIEVPDRITGIMQKVELKGEVNVSNVINGLKNAKTATIEQIKALNSAITTALQGIGTASFASFGDAIAGAVSGSGIAEAFMGLGEFIGSAIQKLGEQMIALSPIILSIQAAIKSFNPALLLPAGIALTALGGVIKSAFANSLPGLQSGGIIPSGFNGDTFFARLNSGEAVIPLDQLWSKLDGFTGGSQNLVVSGILRGNDIMLSQARTARSQRRGG